MQQSESLPKTPPGGLNEFHLGWKVVLAASIGVGVGITGVNTYSLSVFLNPLTEEFGWSRTETSAAKTFLTLGYVLTAPLIGYLADRFGPRKIGMASMIGVVIGMLAMTQMNGQIEMYYLFYFLLALAGCATTPLVWTRGVATWFLEKRGLALGLTLTGSGLAGLIAPSFIGGLIDGYGWQAGYVGMAVLALIGIVPIYFLFFENSGSATGPAGARPNIPRSGRDVVSALKSRHFWQISIAFAFIGGAVSALVVHLVALLTDTGISRETAVSFASLLGFAVVVGRVGTGYLVDRFHAPYVAGFFLVMPAIGCLLLAGGLTSTAVIAFAALSFGLAAGSEVDLLPYLTARYFGLKDYGKIYGWVFVLFYAGVGVGPPFLGWMFDRNGDYLSALMIVGPVLAAGAATVAMLGRPPVFK